MSDVFDLHQPYVPDPTNPERAHRGAAFCRRILATRAGHDDPDRSLDPDSPIRDAALRRARREHRTTPGRIG